MSIAPGCVECAGQPVTETLPPATMAAARKGAALDRSGSIATSLRAERPGGNDPLAWRGALDVHAAVRQCLDRHVDVRHARQAFAAVDQVQAHVEAGCGQQQARDELARGARVDRRPRRRATCPWPRTMKGSAQCPPSSMSTPTSRRALIMVPIGRCSALSCAVRVTSPRAKPASPAHEPHHGAGLTAVDDARALQRPHRRHDQVVAVPAGARGRARCRRRACAAHRSCARSRRSSSGAASLLGPSARAARIELAVGERFRPRER